MYRLSRNKCPYIVLEYLHHGESSTEIASANAQTGSSAAYHWPENYMSFVNDQSFTAENMTVDELVQQLHRPILLSVAETQTAGLSYNIFFCSSSRHTNN